jgi:hypothetical protein
MIPKRMPSGLTRWEPAFGSDHAPDKPKDKIFPFYGLKMKLWQS